MTDPDPPHTPHLTISAFASASRLSVKALRLYDELELLPPARVDEGNGYRLYSPAQLPDARLIARLRGLGLPLADIRRVLDALPAHRPELLRSLWAQQQAEHTRRAELARLILCQLQGETTMPNHSVQTRSVPAQPVATLTRRVSVAELPAAIGAGLSELQQQLAAQGARPTAAPFVIYHGEVNADSDGPIELCQPYAGALQPVSGLILREEPAHHEAFVTLTKAEFAFPTILSAYDDAESFARVHGQSGPLACREVYPHEWDRLNEDDAAGEVAWPYTPR